MFTREFENPLGIRADRYLIILWLSLIALSGTASAETLSGKVLDPEGNSVSGAQVRLFDRNSGELRTTKTSSDGAYRFPGLLPGKYLIESISSSGIFGGSSEITIARDQKHDLKFAILEPGMVASATVSGTPQNTAEVAKTIGVAYSEEIAQRDELSIPEAVRLMPGLRVLNPEGPGGQASIQLRGLPAQDTAVLIDGARFRDAAAIQGDASAFLHDMNIIDTEQIDLMRGNGSSLYGSHAIGGVIQLRSRPGGGPTHGQFLLEGGGLGTFRTAGTIGGGLAKDRFTYSLGVSILNIARGQRNGLPFNNAGTQATAKYNITQKISLTGRLWYSNGHLSITESPTFTDDILANSPSTGEVRAIALPIDQLKLFETGQPFNAGTATYIPSQIDPDSKRSDRFLTGGLTLQHQVQSGTFYQVSYQGVYTRRIFTDGPQGSGLSEPAAPTKNSLNGYTNGLQARLVQQAGRYNLLTAGYEYERERYVRYTGSAFGVETSSWSVKLRQRSNAFYFQDQIRLAGGKLNVTASGRAEFFNLQVPKFAGFESPYEEAPLVDVPAAYTGDVAAAYTFATTGTKLRGHVGNSFRAPSAYERFAGDSGVYYGNPALGPERAVAFDVGVDQKLLNSRLLLSGTVFDANLRQTIFFAETLTADDPYGRLAGYENGEGGIARGVELSANMSYSETTNFGASYTYIYSNSRTPTIGTSYYTPLGLTPHLFTAAASHWLGNRINVTAKMSAYSNSSILLAGGGDRQFVFDGPVKVDAIFRYKFPLAALQDTEFYVKVENLLGQRPYEYGFIGPGAWAVAGIRLKY